MHRWLVCSGRNRPRPAPHQRPGPASGLVLLGDPPSFDEDVSDPHCCVKPLDAVALAVACGDRGVSESTWAAGLLFGADGVAVTVSVDRTAGDASLATATTSNATTVSASMQDICRVPSRPANIPEVSRGRRLPGLMSTPPAIGRLAHPVDPPPPPVDRAPWRIRAHAGASPAATPPYSRIAQLRFGTWASPSTSYGCRARTGFPPACWSPSLSGWLPTTPPQGGSNMAATIAPAPRRHQRNPLITLAAAALKADLAPRHYRISRVFPWGTAPRVRRCATGPAGSDGACASHRPPDEHHHGADHRLAVAGHLHVCRPGFAAAGTLQPLSTAISRASVAVGSVVPPDQAPR